MKRLLNRSVFALLALVAIQPWVKADPLNLTPSLAGFKQIGPRLYEMVFAVDVQEKVPGGFAQFVHVTSPAAEPAIYQMVSGIDGKPETWPVGKTLTGKMQVQLLPANLADGEYEIKYGLYDTTKGNRLELTGKDDGQRRYTLGKLIVSDAGEKLTMPGVPTVTPAMEGRIKVTPSLADFSQTGPRAFSFRIVFDVQEKLPPGEEVFLHITYAKPAPGKDIVVNTGSGLAGTPDTWPVGQNATGELLTITFPAGVPDGIYTIRTGMYDPTGKTGRVFLTGEDDGGRRFVIGRVRVSEGGRKVTLLAGQAGK